MINYKKTANLVKKFNYKNDLVSLHQTYMKHTCFLYNHTCFLYNFFYLKCLNCYRVEIPSLKMEPLFMVKHRVIKCFQTNLNFQNFWSIPTPGNGSFGTILVIKCSKKYSKLLKFREYFTPEAPKTPGAGSF